MNVNYKGIENPCKTLLEKEAFRKGLTFFNLPKPWNIIIYNLEENY